VKHESVSYSCEKCHRALKDAGGLTIRTELYGQNGGPWARLDVKIEHSHGMHNTGETEPAQLCKACTVELLMDALKRVRKGERATEGTDKVEQVNF
jgi:hypothetical protein